MQCGEGCTACCHGLFDISLADAIEVARGFHAFSSNIQHEVQSRAAHLNTSIREVSPDLPERTLINEDDPRIDRIVELDFTNGVPDDPPKDLQQDYSAIDAFDEWRSAAVARRASLPDHRAVTFIPSVIAEFDSFWKLLL